MASAQPEKVTWTASWDGRVKFAPLSNNLCSSSSPELKVGKGGSSAGAEDAAATVESTVNWRGSQKSEQEDSENEGVSKPVGTGEGEGDRDGQEMLAERRSELVVSEGGWINTAPVIG